MALKRKRRIVADYTAKAKRAREEAAYIAKIENEFPELSDNLTKASSNIPSITYSVAGSQQPSNLELEIGDHLVIEGKDGTVIGLLELGLGLWEVSWQANDAFIGVDQNMHYQTAKFTCVLGPANVSEPEEPVLADQIVERKADQIVEGDYVIVNEDDGWFGTVIKADMDVGYEEDDGGYLVFITIRNPVDMKTRKFQRSNLELVTINVTNSDDSDPFDLLGNEDFDFEPDYIENRDD